MRLFKLFTTLLMLCLIGLFFYENAAVFKTTLPFTLDLYIREQVEWSHSLYTVLLFALLVGFLAGVGVMLKPFLRMRRMLGHERHEKQTASSPTSAPALPPSLGEGSAVDQSIEGAGAHPDLKREEPTP